MHVKQHRIGVILGTRPEYLKLAPVIARLEARGLAVETRVMFTGQHRDMLGDLEDLFHIRPFRKLAVRNKQPNLPGLTAALIAALDREFVADPYDAIVVQGDTMTAFCSALTACHHRIPVAHVEAGLRTGNLQEPFPEEMNRQMLARLARWHFAPTAAAAQNLLREGVAAAAVEVTGNTIIDTLRQVRAEKIPADYGASLLPTDAPALSAALRRVAVLGGRTLALLTIHRRENHGVKLEAFFRALRQLAIDYGDHHLIYPYHLNPEVKSRALDFLSGIPNIHLLAPLPYRPFLHLMGRVDFALSDSGGVQEELPSFGKPLLVLRDTTERTEVLQANLARLVGVDPGRVSAATVELIEAARRGETPSWFSPAASPFGDGYAAERIVARIVRDLDAAGVGEP